MKEIRDLSKMGIEKTYSEIKAAELLAVIPRNKKEFMAYYAGVLEDIVYLTRTDGDGVEKLRLDSEVESLMIIETSDLVDSLARIKRENAKLTEAMRETAEKFEWIIEFARQERQNLIEKG